MVDYSGYIIGFISAIIVALLVYTLNVRSTEKEKKEQKIAVHKLIKLEIDYNLKLIKDFFNEINEKSKEDNEEKRYILENIPIPPLNNGMYNKFALFLPNSVTEFEKLYEFYRNLDDLKFKYNKMILILTRDNSIVLHSFSPEVPDQVRPGRMPESDEILLNELWNEFEEIIDKLLDKGNPIKKNRI
jgi:hypothetical protein